MYNRIIKIWIVFICLLILGLSFELGLYFSSNSNNHLTSSPQLVYVENNNKSDDIVEDLNLTISSFEEKEKEYKREISDLNSKIAGAQTIREYPFSTPTKGILAKYAGTFGGNMNGYRHLGIDLWTTTKNNGMLPDHKGNPVYAACSGIVDNIDKSNGAVTINCDQIPNSFKVPEHKVYTHYAHLGNADTGELFINVHGSQRVKEGDILGYQGDLSSYFPDMRNVHLHFSIFTGLSETDKSGGALNPCLYIGGDCTEPGMIFSP